MICCPRCHSLYCNAQSDFDGMMRFRCNSCCYVWNHPSKESNVSDIVLPTKGHWIRVTERKMNHVTKIHEGPVYGTAGAGGPREVKSISLGADSWRYTVILNSDEGFGFPTWEYISPPEPNEDGSVWVIPHDGNQVILWQRQPDRSGRCSECWFSPGVSSGLAWTAIIDRERGYLLEVKRD